jgi:ribosome-binding factor A
MKERTKRLNEMISRFMSSIFLKELELPKGVFLTVIKTEISKDLRSVKIYVSIFPQKESKNILKILNARKRFFRWKLGELLKIKFVPEIFFKEEKGMKRDDEVEMILEELKKEKKEIK